MQSNVGHCDYLSPNDIIAQSGTPLANKFCMSCCEMGHLTRTRTHEDTHEHQITNSNELSPAHRVRSCMFVTPTRS